MDTLEDTHTPFILLLCQWDTCFSFPKRPSSGLNARVTSGAAAAGTSSTCGALIRVGEGARRRRWTGSIRCVDSENKRSLERAKSPPGGTASSLLVAQVHCTEGT